MARTLSPLFGWRSALCDSDLAPTQRHVAMTLSLHMSERGDSCFPSLPTLARETGYSIRTVIRALHVLQTRGWLSVKRGGGRGRPNRYTATIPTVPVNSDMRNSDNSDTLSPFQGHKQCHGGSINSDTVTPEDVKPLGRTTKPSFRVEIPTPQPTANLEQIRADCEALKQQLRLRSRVRT